jgi:hypothetical protein
MTFFTTEGTEEIKDQSFQPPINADNTDQSGKPCNLPLPVASISVHLR